MSLEIIAEAAQGYLGDPPAKTKLLVRMAAAAGADAVKFQLVYADELCTEQHHHFRLFSALEMADADWAAVAETCRAAKIPLYLDIFGPRSLELACRLGVRGLKVHSTDLLNLPLLRQVAEAPIRRVLLSTGGTFAPEIEEAAVLLGRKELVLLHGFQGYPTRLEDNHLARLDLLRARFPRAAIGFADHVPGNAPERLWLSAAAVGAGATVLEKHLTTALVMREEDHEAALNPDDFSGYAANMRRAYAALGEVKEGLDFGMSDGELAYREQMKKHVVAARDLPAGTVLEAADLALKRSEAAEPVLHDLRAAQGRRLRAALARDRAVRRGDLW